VLGEDHHLRTLRPVHGGYDVVGATTAWAPRIECTP